MRTLLTILLLLAVAVPASALDRRPRKKDKKKNKTEAVVTPPTAPVAEQQAAPEPEEPELPRPRRGAVRRHDPRAFGRTGRFAGRRMARTAMRGFLPGIFRQLHPGRQHDRRHAPRFGLHPAAAGARFADPVALQQHRTGLYQPLHRFALRHDQPHPGHVAVLFPAHRGRTAQGGAPRRTAGTADHRIGAFHHGRVADGRP